MGRSSHSLGTQGNSFPPPTQFSRVAPGLTPFPPPPWGPSLCPLPPLRASLTREGQPSCPGSQWGRPPLQQGWKLDSGGPIFQWNQWLPAFDAILSQRQEGDHAAGWNTGGEVVLGGPYRPPRGSPGQNWGRGKPSLGVLFSELDNLFFF